ncbi:TonB-dependent receptor [Paraflavitalea pollutisoli]|uniref:TonB-dependent receptor n=1 Tax=Paraflavitalea pollutisoli TaxID=3034143 RepID=UPI0023EB9FC6|nr:carboxypeptidase-like regulatory domain-containing protein [Paraflavitalea sp. H1-2-19X]
MKKALGILALLGSMLTAHAQKFSFTNRPFQPSLIKGTVREFLDDINKNGKVLIEYASTSVETERIIVLNDHPATLGSVLQQVLKGQKLSIVEKNNKVILVPAAVPLPDDLLLNYFAVYGLVKDEVSGEPLPDATLWQPVLQKGGLSNTFGHYSVMLPEGKQTLYISYAGYNTRRVELDLLENTRIDLNLQPRPAIEEVTVTAGGKTGDEVNLAEQANAVQDMFLGEPDVIRSLYMQPGVKNTPEITNGLLVRGGSPDQNVFLLDGNTVFNPTHMLGSLFIINRASVKSLHLYKSNFPAQYGGGLSSVIDVITKDGNLKEWKGEVNAGVLAGSLTLEGPVKKDRSAIMLSLRHSWINPLLRAMKSGIGVNFYDVHAKFTQWIGKQDKLMFDVYAGEDQLTLHQDYTNNRQQWGNRTASIGWNRLLGSKAFINTSVNYSRYRNIAGFRYNLYDSTGSSVQNRVYNTYSSIQQFTGQSRLELTASNKVRIITGVRANFMKVRPFDSNISTDFFDKPGDFSEFPPIAFRELVYFAESEYRPNKRLYVRPGIHVSFFTNNEYDYTSWQPRLLANYRLSRQHQVSVAYNHMTQYLHLVTNPYLGINGDAWVPSTGQLSPEECDMINLGYTFRDRRKFVVSAEVYYKQLRNVTNYVEGKNLFLNTADWEQNVQSGKGWCYGVELKTEKTTNKWYMQASYTLSWNWRRFTGINNDEKFPFKYDRRHVLNVAATYRHNKHWNFSTLWTFSTGDVFTLPDRGYPDFDDAQQILNPLSPKEYRLIYHSSAINQYRTLPYHRLDVAGTYELKHREKLASRISMGVYNVYGSPNQYVYDLEGTFGKRSLVVTTKYQFFKITPYVSYSLVF